MDLNSIVYGINAENVQLVVNAKDLRDFADNLVKFAKQTIIERDQPEYYSRYELASMLHVSQPTLLEWNKKGLLPKPIKISGRVLYDKAKVRKALRVNREISQRIPYREQVELFNKIKEDEEVG